MAYIIENFIQPELALKIKELCLVNDFQNSGKHPDTGDLQWENSPVPTNVFDKLTPLLDTVFEEYTVDKVPNFQRCYVPFGIHHDSKKRHNPNKANEECVPEGHAIIIPLDEGPYFNTVFWKEKCFDTDDMIDGFQQFSKLAEHELKNSGIGDQYDLAFSWGDPRPGYQYYNHLTLDCVFNWRIGDAAVFDRNQLHAASDFTAHCPYKDAITIFFK